MAKPCNSDASAFITGSVSAYSLVPLFVHMISMLDVASTLVIYDYITTVHIYHVYNVILLDSNIL